MNVVRVIVDRPGTQRFNFVKASLEDQAAMRELFEAHPFDGVVHLAAQAGVRYSLTHPHAYIESNITGFLNILEGVRAQQEKLGFSVAGRSGEESVGNIDSDGLGLGPHLV